MGGGTSAERTAEERQVAESLDTDEWKAGLRVEEPGPISISETGEEKKGNEDREN